MFVVIVKPSVQVYVNNYIGFKSKNDGLFSLLFNCQEVNVSVALYNSLNISHAGKTSTFQLPLFVMHILTFPFVFIFLMILT